MDVTTAHRFVDPRAMHAEAYRAAEAGAAPRADGGTGIDTFQLEGAGLTLGLTMLANPGAGTPASTSRWESIDCIDLTGSGNDTLTIGLRDVIDTSGMNVFNNTNGWLDGTCNLAASGATGANPEQRHPLVIDGDAGDISTSAAGRRPWAR